jgi:hypothetical protein
MGINPGQNLTEYQVLFDHMRIESELGRGINDFPAVNHAPLLPRRVRESRGARL